MHQEKLQAMQPHELTAVIETFIIAPLQEASAVADCLVAFVTGSYVFGKQDPVNPNINIYFLVKDGAGPAFRLALADVFQSIRRTLRQQRINFCIDCHPYTVSYRELDFSHAITLTTKVMEHKTGASAPWSLPPTIGQLWLNHIRILSGNDFFLQELSREARPDPDWFHAIHEALSRYKNILDHLPWCLDWVNHPALLAEESLRYAEEAMKDSLTLALHPEEINSDIRTNLYVHWQDGAAGCLAERFGEEGKWLAGTVAGMKARFRTEETWTVEAATEFWKTALAAWEIVWKKYQDRLLADIPAPASWMKRVNAFV